MDVFTVGAFVDDFLLELQTHDRTKAMFHNIDKTKYNRMMAHVVDMIVSKRPVDIDHLLYTHAHLNITDEDTAVWLACLTKVLKRFQNDTNAEHVLVSVAKCAHLIVHTQQSHERRDTTDAMASDFRTYLNKLLKDLDSKCEEPAATGVTSSNQQAKSTDRDILMYLLNTMV